MNSLPALLWACPIICASSKVNWWPVSKLCTVMRKDMQRLRTAALCGFILVFSALPVYPTYLALHGNRQITPVFASRGMVSLAFTRVVLKVAVGLCATLML